MGLVLRKVAEENGDFQVVGEAANGVQALALFEELRPNVVFIDIDLPGKDGVTLAREIFDLDPQVQLVFITALDQYREDAFEVYACDYIVKPFKLERLRRTLERLRVQFSDQTEGQPTAASRLFRTGTKTMKLSLPDILYITREERRTVVYHTGGRLETGENLTDLEKELGRSFLRTHKGYIVNLQMVREILPAGRNTFELVMVHTTERPLVTRKKYRELKQALKNKK